MKIREIEELSGMPRANIRFYEAEGLLRPDRDANGYRNYSEEDLRILQKIRLLRALHVSLEDIRQVASGKRHLEDVLSFHLRTLRDQEEDHRSSREICESCVWNRRSLLLLTRSLIWICWRRTLPERILALKNTDLMQRIRGRGFLQESWI